MFEILTINVGTTRETFGGHKWVVTVAINVDVKEWTKLRNKKQLGQLYGVDICNAIHKINPDVPAWNPTVDSSMRASGGIKPIEFTFYISNADIAEKLGMKVTRFKNGEVMSAFSEHKRIYVRNAVVTVTEYEGVAALNRIYGGK